MAAQPPAQVVPRVSLIHLPALAHVAADLDDIDYPIRIVEPTELSDCDTGPDGDLPALGAIATVIAYDPHRHHDPHRDTVCALHLDPTVRDHARRGRTVVVEVPASGGTRWFERSPRETYYAVDESGGVAVVRHLWDCWAVVDAAGGIGGVGALWTGPGRAVGEAFAQDHAARLAADAYELAQTAAWPLPVASVVAEVAAA